MRADLDPRSTTRDPLTEAVGDRLRALPAELSPPRTWDEMAARVLRSRRDQGGRRAIRLESLRLTLLRPRALAGVACIALLVVAGVIASRHSPRGPGIAHSVRPIAMSPQPHSAEVGRATAVQAGSTTAAADKATQEMLARAAVAERWLASQSAGPPVVHVGSRLAVADLENRIASVDDELDTARVLHRRPSSVRDLELEHAELVDSLAQVRYAMLLADGTQQ